MLWVLKEPSQWDGSFEHPKDMFKLMGKEMNALLDAQTILIWTYDKCALLFWIQCTLNFVRISRYFALSELKLKRNPVQ